jgi:hypothetical protein
MGQDTGQMMITCGLDSKQNVLILKTDMFIAHKDIFLIFIKVCTCFLILAALNSCGVSGNENKTEITKETAVAAKKANGALHYGADPINNVKVSGREKATFALG